MQGKEILATGYSNMRRSQKQIAPWPHLAVLLLIAVVIAVLGVLAQYAAGLLRVAPSGQIASHSQALPAYIGNIVFDWLLLAYCWAGVRWSGGNLATMSGDRWTTWKSLGTDLAIALPFWLFYIGVARAVHHLIGSNTAKSISSLLPVTPIEILVFIGSAITSGICEELVFRGYLQRQLHALGGNIWLAIMAQGFVFGIGHSYQGWKQVLMITVLGILFGILAAWRRNLRANILVHSWADIWAGWLQMVLWR